MDEEITVTLHQKREMLKRYTRILGRKVHYETLTVTLSINNVTKKLYQVLSS
jgi:hypothetical protein